MKMTEKPVLQVKNLCVRYGDGCPECAAQILYLQYRFFCHIHRFLTSLQ